MKVIVSESKLGIEYLADVISSCNQNGIECIVDDNAGEILYYLPKEGRYGDDKLLQNSDKSIFDLVKDKEQLVNVLRDAKGDEFKKFAVKWNGLQIKGEDEEVYKTDHCNPIRGNFSEGSSGSKYDAKNLNSKIATWYGKAYPSDKEMADEMRPRRATFQDVIDALDNGEDVYEVIGAGDSVVRERVFQELCQLTGKDYGYFYDKWLSGGDRKRYGGISKMGSDILERLKNTRDDFGMRVNGIEAQVSEGNKIDTAVVYWKDKSEKPMDIDQVHSLNEVLDVLDGMMYSEPEGDLPEIDHIRIGNKDYDQDAIEKYRADMDDMVYNESEDNLVDWCGHPMTKEQAELCDRFWGGDEDLATEFDSAWEDEFGKSAWYWTAGADHMSQQLSDDLETRPDEFETNGYTDEFEGWGQDIVADAVCTHGLTTWEEVHDFIDASLKHTLMEKSQKVDEDIDNPNDWSSSEGEVEIVWTTSQYEDFGIFEGDTGTYVIDYDRVDDHDDLLVELSRLIGKEYPDLDFEVDDFEITNEKEFWDNRRGGKELADGCTEIEGIPDWATSYLINGDDSGLSEDDKADVDRYVDDLASEGLALAHPIEGTENEFDRYPAFGKACATSTWIANEI